MPTYFGAQFRICILKKSFISERISVPVTARFSAGIDSGKFSSGHSRSHKSDILEAGQSPAFTSVAPLLRYGGGDGVDTGLEIK